MHRVCIGASYLTAIVQYELYSENVCGRKAECCQMERGRPYTLAFIPKLVHQNRTGKDQTLILYRCALREKLYFSMPECRPYYEGIFKKSLILCFLSSLLDQTKGLTLVLVLLFEWLVL